ncbi:hypothetical protein C7C45_18890 [Micromonospora arborensis]|uniref:Uncharacterized protein n=1 Tax=Micromonospora arborensis TaxID=2116518 RepID=A0A318P0H6_9ACTN|nr:hypothetical protein C7C45_18890 [Micromonospora arborensis]
MHGGPAPRSDADDVVPSTGGVPGWRSSLAGVHEVSAAIRPKLVPQVIGQARPTAAAAGWAGARVVRLAAEFEFIRYS